MKNVWKKSMAMVLIMSLMLGLMVGCGGGPVDADEEKNFAYPIELYYVSSAYLETGDDSIEPMVVVKSEATAQVEEADEIYEATLEALVQIPGEGEDTMVREGMIDDVTVTDGVAVVDFNEDYMHGGSLEEVYLIEQVVRTLIKSFDEVQKVRFTVEGEAVDSLMGHLEANCTYGLITVQEDGTDLELVTIMDN